MIPFKTYCINLDRRPDRWQQVSEQFAKHRLAVERYPAVDGKAIGITPVEAFTASHFGVIAEAIIDKLPMVLILEDDVILHDDFNALLKTCLQHLPDDWCMLYLGGTHRQKPAPVNEYISRVTHTLTTHAYLLRNTMYQVLIEKLFGATEPADCVYTGLQKEYPCYVTNPPLAWQRAGFSDIEGRVMDYPWIKTNEQ